MEKAYASRYELDEADRKRLEAMYEKGRSFVTGAQMGWFKRICKLLGEMEEYM
jgi:hypothetical protein